MRHRLKSFLVEMIGSAAICAFAYVAAVLIGAHRQRALRV
jgi:hypothetical protein